jgi:hypothetical protein
MAIPVANRRKRGNPNWGRPMPPAAVLATEFELQAKQLQLTPEMYASSRELRDWCWQNRNRIYIPEWLLAEWRLDVDPTFSAAA